MITIHPARATGSTSSILVPDSARGELDPIPYQHICRDELGEPRRHPMTQSTHDGDLRSSPHEPARGAHLGVGEPAHSGHP
jgi:hypothetical protein